MLRQDKRTIAEIAARLTSGMLAAGQDADVAQVVAQAVALVTEVERVVDEQSPPFADDSQAILTLRQAGYEVAHREEFEGRAKLFLERRGFAVQRRKLAVQRRKLEESDDETGTKTDTEATRVQDPERPQGDRKR